MKKYIIIFTIALIAMSLMPVDKSKLPISQIQGLNNTLTAAELNKLDGLLSTRTELNLMHGIDTTMTLQAALDTINARIQRVTVVETDPSVYSWAKASTKPTYTYTEVGADAAGAAAAITLSGLGGVPTSRTVNGYALSGDVMITKTDLGLENLDNTADVNKPISTATQTALNLKAPLISPSFTTPALGVASATSINKVAVTAPTTSAILTIADGKTFTASNTLTVSGTDGSTLNVGTGGTLGTGAYATIANYAPIASPTFTGTVGGITKTMVGLGNVDNTSDASKPISTITGDSIIALRGSIDVRPTLTEAQAAFIEKGDTVSAEDLFYLKTVANAEFQAKGDTISADSIFYTKPQVEAIKKYGVVDDAIALLTGTRYLRPFGGTASISGTVSMTDGYMLYNTVAVFDTVTVSNMETMITVQGNYTADNYNGMAIMKLNLSTYTWDLVVNTTNDGDIWKATINTAIVKAITPTQLLPGIYAFCAIYNTSDASPVANPTIVTFGIINSYEYLLHGGHFVAAVKTEVSAVPSSQIESGLIRNSSVTGIIAY